MRARVTPFVEKDLQAIIENQEMVLVVLRDGMGNDDACCVRVGMEPSSLMASRFSED